MTNFQEPRFTDEAAAREHLERLRWPDGQVCPRCGGMSKVTKCEGEAYRAGLYNCADCRRQFTVTVGTVYERSKIPLHKWVLATYLLCSSKKGMSAHQLHRMLDLPYKTAWFMAHRIRASMIDTSKGGIGGEGKVVEADETYLGDKDVVTKRTKRGKAGLGSKRAIVALVERGGKAKTFHIQRADSETVKQLLRTTASRESELMTDESRLYTDVGSEYARHGKVNHTAGEYVSWDDPTIHTNTVEGFFSIFKRGMKGIYQHCGEAHLHRYLTEFEFRYNNRVALGVGDVGRADIALANIGGKRLTYYRPQGSAHP
jgi:transposase-like protein